jgi:hypothetical protein
VRIAAVVVLALALAPVASGAGEAVAVRTALTPGPYLFGDQITATLDVIVDTDRVDPDTVRVDTKFLPYERVSAPQRSETRDGSIVRIRYRYLLTCDSLACAGTDGLERRFLFPPARVRYRDAHGHAKTKPARWTFVQLISRYGQPHGLTATEATQSVQFASTFTGHLRASVVPPAASYRLDPWLLALLLFAGSLAALLGAGAVGRPLLALARRGDADAGRELSPLEQALESVDAAARKQAGSAEHREALAWLARELRRDGPAELVRRARRLAWAEQAPTAADSRALTNDVRAEH